MTVRQLFYISRATPGAVDDQVVRSLLAVSQRNNRRRDLTGCLLYSGSLFAQVLEGRATELETLVAAIARDPRHTDLRVLVDRPVLQRHFGTWAMGFIYRQDLADRLTALMTGGDIAPEAALGLLDTLAPDSLMGAL